MKFSFNFKNSKGAATLPTIFALIILIVAISIALTSLSLSDSFIFLGAYQSSQALIFAEEGIKDALLRITRNKNYSCPNTDCYSIEFSSNGCQTNEACARVSVSGGEGSIDDPKIIIAKGQVKNKIRKIQAEVIFDENLNGKIENVIWKEIKD